MIGAPLAGARGAGARNNPMIDVARREERQTPSRSLPIVAVSGQWGKTTTARLLEAMIRQRHPRLALWTDQGVYFNGRRQLGELAPWGEALRSLTAGDLDLAIQELDAQTVNAVGLPTAAYALGIITSFCGNDEACLLHPRAASERQAQGAVARAVHQAGALVLNADDHAVAEGGADCRGAVIYYGMSRRNPFIRAHLAAGGRAVCVSGGMIVLCEGARSQPVLPTRDVAISLGGAIVFQVQNALAAVAAAWWLDVPAGRIAATLRGFTSEPTIMPGACNQLQIDGATVIVDRLHDALSARALLRGVRKVRGRHRRLALAPADGGLDAAELTDIGRLLGRSFDLIAVHPGRGDAAQVEALRAGVALNPLPPMLLTPPDETAALEKLLPLLHANDLLLVLASDLALVLRTLLTHRPLADARVAAPAK